MVCLLVWPTAVEFSRGATCVCVVYAQTVVKAWDQYTVYWICFVLNIEEALDMGMWKLGRKVLFWQRAEKIGESKRSLVPSISSVPPLTHSVEVYRNLENLADNISEDTPNYLLSHANSVGPILRWSKSSLLLRHGIWVDVLHLKQVVQNRREWKNETLA